MTRTTALRSSKEVAWARIFSLPYGPILPSSVRVSCHRKITLDRRSYGEVR